MRRAGSRGAICCPYHSWCHATTGDLVATPHVGGPGQNTHDAIRRAELELIEIRYREGAESLISLIDAQRQQLAAEDAELQARYEALRRRVDVYRALGG